jgi:hypothetical protein
MCRRYKQTSLTKDTEITNELMLKFKCHRELQIEMTTMRQGNGKFKNKLGYIANSKLP